MLSDANPLVCHTRPACTALVLGAVQLLFASLVWTNLYEWLFFPLTAHLFPDIN